MSNPLNNKSRFAILIDNKTPTTNSGNKKKSKKKPNTDIFARRNINNHQEPHFERKVDNNKLPNIAHDTNTPNENLVKIENPLSLEHFPEMINIKKHVNNNVENTIKNVFFSEKVKSKAIDKAKDLNVDIDFQNLAPGWTVIKKDNVKNNIVMKTKETLKPIEQNDTDFAFNVLDTLVDLNNTKRSEYIEKWGYELWEKMYRFPNYDYEYFDKLDELNYLSEEEISEENDYNDGYAYDNDYY